MDQDYVTDGPYYIYDFLGSDKCRSLVYLYASDWAYLMEVVERIEAMPDDPYHGRFGVHISSNSCTIQGTNFRSDKIADPPIYFSVHDGKTKIEATYMAAVSFIKWYNNELRKIS